MTKEEGSNHYGLFNLIKAGIAVANGPVSLHPSVTHIKGYAREYGSGLDLNREDLFNPNEESLGEYFEREINQTIENGKFKPNTWNQVPWSDGKKLCMDRLAGTIISFSDDHKIPLADEFFPVDQMIKFLSTIQARYTDLHRKQSIIDQFRIAMELSDNNPIAAALLAHSSYRSVARVMDKRVDERLRFPIRSTMDSISMINLAKSTAHFKDNAHTTDPLGDSYHWWGQFAAGMVFQLYTSSKPLRARAYKETFYYGPALMSFARETIQGKPMVAGNHKDVDRQALRLGKRIGKFISKNIPEI